MCVRSVNKLKLKVLIFIFGLLISFLINIIALYVFKNIVLMLLGVFLFLGCSIISVDFDLAHPYVWFLSIFFLYTIAYPVLVGLNILPYKPTILQAIFYHYLAMLIFSLFVQPKRYFFSFKDKTKSIFLIKNSIGIKIFLILSIIIMFLYIKFLITSGITDKQERILLNTPFAFLGFGSYIFICVISLILIRILLNCDMSSKRKKIKFWFINICSVFFLSIYFLFTGERHVFFRYILIMVIVYHILYKHISAKKLIFLFLCGIISAAIMQQFKLFFLKSNHYFSFKSIMHNILWSEFKCPLRNLTILLEAIPQTYPYFYGKALLGDIERAIIPGFLCPHYFHSELWFAKTFFPNSYNIGLGMGFTLVGASYMNFGVFGILFLFSLIGLLVKWLYKKASRSLLFFIIYINFVPILSFSIRGDFSLLFSSLWKHVILVLLIIYFVDYFIYICLTDVTQKSGIINATQTRGEGDTIRNEKL